MTTSVTVEHIADQVMALPPSERGRLVDWLFDQELGHDSWDEQIAKDNLGGDSKKSCQKCVATLKQDKHDHLMNSSTTPDFWSAYRELPSAVQRRAKKAYRLWLRNPRHPSPQFNKAGLLWSIRIGSEYRALALHQNAVYYWFWIGRHDAYEQLITASSHHKE